MRISDCGVNNQRRERKRPVTNHESRNTSHRKLQWPNEPTAAASATPLTRSAKTGDCPNYSITPVPNYSGFLPYRAALDFCTFRKAPDQDPEPISQEQGGCRPRSTSRKLGTVPLGNPSRRPDTSRGRECCDGAGLSQRVSAIPRAGAKRAWRSGRHAGRP